MLRNRVMQVAVIEEGTPDPDSGQGRRPREKVLELEPAEGWIPSTGRPW